MNKPFTIQVQETEQKIVEVINSSQLPVYVIKKILERIYTEAEKIENEEINQYNEQENIKKEKEMD